MCWKLVRVSSESEVESSWIRLIVKGEGGCCCSGGESSFVRSIMEGGVEICGMGVGSEGDLSCDREGDSGDCVSDGVVEVDSSEVDG